MARLSQYYLVKDASKELSSRPLCEQNKMHDLYSCSKREKHVTHRCLLYRLERLGLLRCGAFSTAHRYSISSSCARAHTRSGRLICSPVLQVAYSCLVRSSQLMDDLVTIIVNDFGRRSRELDSAGSVLTYELGRPHGWCDEHRFRFMRRSS